LWLGLVGIDPPPVTAFGTEALGRFPFRCFVEPRGHRLVFGDGRRFLRQAAKNSLRHFLGQAFLTNPTTGRMENEGSITIHDPPEGGLVSAAGEESKVVAGISHRLKGKASTLKLPDRGRKSQFKNPAGVAGATSSATLALGSWRLAWRFLG